jgi:hypothetical protein
MPLAFATLNRGVVPFGFFNIRTDMVLLAQYFAFADDVCGWIEALAATSDEVDTRRPAWIIADRVQMGDLHGAMAGDDLSGFIGEVYARFPFPALREDFRQDPDGQRIRLEIEPLIDRFAQRQEIAIRSAAAAGTVEIGEYSFDEPGFAELVRYLWRGGFPRWRDDRPPDYIDRMMEAVRSSPSWLFLGEHWPE